MQWEYRLYSTDPERTDDQIETALNDLGQDRWELVTSYLSTLRIVFILKRAIQPK